MNNMKKRITARAKKTAVRVTAKVKQKAATTASASSSTSSPVQKTKGSKEHHGTKEQRLQNMNRQTSRVNQILRAINETNAQYKRAYDSLPSEIKAKLSRQLGMLNMPHEGEYNLEDFYVYDYEGEMLPAMVNHLFGRIRSMNKMLNFLEEFIEQAMKAGKRDEDDMQELNRLRNSISDLEGAIAEAASKHGTFVAIAKASDAPNRYNDFNTVLDIVSNYGG